MFPFYVNVVVHTLLVFLVLFVIPESLSTEARTILTKNAKLAKEARQRREELEIQWEDEDTSTTIQNTSLANTNNNDENDDTLVASSTTQNTPIKPNRNDSTWSRISGMTGVGDSNNQSRRRKKFNGRLRRLFRRAIAPLQPLEIFLPTVNEDGKREWNLTVLGLALLSMSFIYVSLIPALCASTGTPFPALFS